MKKLFFLLPLILSSYFSFGQWVPQYTGTANTLTDVVFINQDTGLVSGVHTILRTIDGGKTWTKQGYQNYFLEGICFSSGANAFAVGFNFTSSKAIILKSSDYGGTWSVKTIPVNSILKDVFFVNSNIGFAIGTGGVVLKTINAGSSWNILPTGTSLTLYSVFFKNANNGTIVGGHIGKSIILKTTNGGQNWSSDTTLGTTSFQSVYFPSQNVGYIAGWDGQILKTENGGNSWVLKQSVPSDGDLDIHFINDSVGYIAGGNPDSAYIKKTINGGTSWTGYKTQATQGMVAVFFPTNSIGYCVGSGGLILKTTNGGTLNILGNTLKVEFNLFPNPVIDILKIDCDNYPKNLTVSVFDSFGRLYIQKQISELNHNLNLSRLKAGQYIITISTAEGRFISKIIKI